MTQVVSSISGLEIYSPSAGYAPTNSGDVSAIASGYQVVSSTATQLYAGTAFLTEVNGATVSASRAGQAANASMANSAYYDGTGRLISALPDSAAVSSIASSYAESAVSGKADSSSLSSYALSSDVSGVIDTVSANSASWGQSGIDSATVSAIASSYAESAVSSKLDTTAQVVSATAGDGTYVTSINGMGISGQGGGATGDYVEKSALNVEIGTANSASANAFTQGASNTAYSRSFAQGTENSAYQYAFAQGSYNSAHNNSFAQGTLTDAVKNSIAQGTEDTASDNSFAQGQICNASFASFAQGYFSEASNTSFAQGVANIASGTSFAQGGGNTASAVSFAQGYYNSAINTAAVFGRYNLHGDGSTSTGDSAAFAIGDGTASGARHDLMLVTKDGEITMFSSTADTVGLGLVSSIKAISAAATGATGDYVDKSATAVAIGSSNTASYYSFAQGVGNSAYSTSFAQGKNNSAVATAFAGGISSTASGTSFAYGYTNYATGGSVVIGMRNSAYNTSVAMGSGNNVSAGSQCFGIQNVLSGKSVWNAKFNREDHIGGMAIGRCNKDSAAAFVIGDSLYNTARHDLMTVSWDGEITMFSSTADTVGTGIMSSLRAISAAATGGGVDSATVSAIASSYAESAASGKLDTTAFNSGDFYTTANESGYVGSAYVDSAVSGKMDTFSAGEGLEFVQSGSDQVLQVEAPVDIVAGPGIVIDNPDGNTLRVSQTEPVVGAVRDCENWNGHTMKCIILRGAYTTNTSMQNQYIENVLPVGTTIAFIDVSNSYVVYGDNPQINMMVPYCIDYNRLFSPWVDITNRRVNLRYIDVSNNITCTYYLCVKYTID